MEQENKFAIEKMLCAFWNEMNAWEKSTYSDYVSGNESFEIKVKNALDLLIPIYEKYLTKKTRLTGRLAGPDAAMYPEYDTSLEEIVLIEEVASKKFIVLTKRRDHNILDYFTEHRYKVVMKNGVFLIDAKESYSFYKEKWVRDVF